MNEAEDVLETIYGNWTDSMYIGPANDPNSAHCVWRLGKCAIYLLSLNE